MATLLDRVVGFVGGGPSRVEAAGAAALIASKAEQTRNKILEGAEKFGAKLGPKWGADIFGALYKGAEKPAEMAVAAKERELFGVDRQTLLLGGAAVLGGLLLILMVRRK